MTDSNISTTEAGTAPAAPASAPTVEVSEVELIEQYVKATGGEHPFPRSPEAWVALPLTVRETLRQAAPHLFQRWSADVTKLSAKLELRVSRGALDFDAQEISQLEAAGYADLVQQSHTARRAHLMQTWEVGRQIRIEARDAQLEADRQERAQREVQLQAMAVGQRQQALKAHFFRQR